MSDQVKLITIEPHDGHMPGELYIASERTAAKLIGRRLVKMAVPVRNKMALPHANKANPSPAAGEAQPSSASPAAQASPATTAHSLRTGGLPQRGRAVLTLPKASNARSSR